MAPKGTQLYKVSIPKCYFPKDSWPKGVTLYMETVKMFANSRSEAAQKAWQKHGNRWLKMSAPKVTKIRHWGLAVNYPQKGPLGFASRYETIRVYSEITYERMSNESSDCKSGLAEHRRVGRIQG